MPGSNTCRIPSRDSAEKPPARDAAIAALDRPVPAGVNAAGFGSDVVADALRALDIPYIALNPGASYRGLHDSLVNYLGNERAADAALPARGERGRDRARLCQGHRQGDGRGGALQCRADARHHGDLQRLVRPHADGRARRHRPGRRGQAPAVDRLDPHRARPGRAGARLHQMGRPAGLARRRARSDAARRAGSPIPRRAGRSTSISTPACRRQSSPSRCRRSTPQRFMPRGRTARRPPSRSRKAADDAAQRQAAR